MVYVSASKKIKRSSGKLEQISFVNWAVVSPGTHISGDIFVCAKYSAVIY